VTTHPVAFLLVSLGFLVLLIAPPPPVDQMVPVPALPPSVRALPPSVRALPPSVSAPPRPVSVPAPKAVAPKEVVIETRARRGEALLMAHGVPSTTHSSAVTTSRAPSAPGVAPLADIPLIALAAYRAAADGLARSDPGCTLDWTTIAAIGRVESDHGRYGGARLSPDGSTSPLIRGAVLDGAVDAALVADTDGGAIDGNPEFDRAVGPMQFIPSSWRTYASDGNGDGQANPDNIFDAALAAARYLCAGGRDLRDLAQLRAAVFRYNHSESYVDLVLVVAGHPPTPPAGRPPHWSQPPASMTVTAPSSSPPPSTRQASTPPPATSTTGGESAGGTTSRSSSTVPTTRPTATSSTSPAKSRGRESSGPAASSRSAGHGQ
jgi:transglycosylase-like protein with SLT domain